MARETLASLKAAHERLNRVNEELAAALRQAKKPITDMNDPRLNPVWDKAHEAANDAGHCSEFDEIMEEMDAPGRAQDVRITIRLTGKVRSPEQYAERVRMWLDHTKNPFRRIFPDIAVVEPVREDYDIDFI